MKTLLFILLSCITLFASNLEDAQAAYNAGDYERAAYLWKTELDEGLKNAEIFFNLGNANYRLSNLGFAIYYYESAKALAPNDADIDYNLKLAKSKTKDKTEDTEENPILSGLLSLHHALSLKNQLICILALSWLIAIFAVIRFAFHIKSVRNVCLGTMFIAVLCLCTFAISALYKIFVAETETLGVVVATSADVLSGPGLKNQTLNVLSEGTEFQVLEVQEGFARISLGDRIKGFISLSEIGIVKN